MAGSELIKFFYLPVII